MFEYQLIRSKRKTISAQILRDGKLVVRAPLFCPVHFIEDFLNKKNNVLEKYREEILALPTVPTVKRSELESMKREAARKILPRVELLSKKTGLSYNGAKITSARHRFGSCSGQNRLCFSAFLVLASPDEIDYVILHELCHTMEHNHSPRFYSLVLRYMPDYKKREQNLKKIIIPEIVE